MKENSRNLLCKLIRVQNSNSAVLTRSGSYCTQDVGVCECKIQMSKKNILPEVIFTADVKHYLRNTGLAYVKIKNNRICQKGKI